MRGITEPERQLQGAWFFSLIRSAGRILCPTQLDFKFFVFRVSCTLWNLKPTTCLLSTSLLLESRLHPKRYATRGWAAVHFTRRCRQKKAPTPPHLMRRSPSKPQHGDSTPIRTRTTELSGHVGVEPEPPCTTTLTSPGACKLTTNLARFFSPNNPD